MKRPSNESIDNMIAEALNDNDRAEFEALGEPTLFEQIAESFRGRTRWLNAILIVDTILFTSLFVFSVIQFFGATEIRDQILWASTSVLAMVIIGLVKIWFWMEMNRVAIMREIKRLELQIVRLANK